ncbi:MAG: tRNA (N(6)-L-threonylcarbamoyladenosine(37)-C(2))-methylthiotransferase MtaB [Bacteroidetes bacterium]|nr:tRNA (N(6)-L-threonylcarbamoyladenosine(37)-C(2))-methylthiotransferase MtaB [Bacteroidota bacterium]MCB9042420.1 tRNA (N(6)-L-threonylcarbamoyladenosine(37)-C(2))-methylthiotransferase MtaB [Chitinophagales bacterium]
MNSSSTPSVSFYTLGCKLNYTETEAISRQMQSQGFTEVAFGENPADVYIINTCSVTDQADKKCRYVLRQVRRMAPEAKVIVVGCYAQLKPAEIAAIPGVDLVLGASEKFNIPQHLSNLYEKSSNKGTYIACDIDNVADFKTAYASSTRTRAFLKVQDGCDYSCSFCTIPLARGNSRSDTIENIVSTAYEIAESGVREIVLTGVNIGDYGKGLAEENKASFLHLIQALDKVTDIARFRISSIEPNLLSEDIIDFVAASERFVPHFHIPLQAGDNRILGLMRRRYRRELYAERVAAIKAKMPDACIGVDIMVGFPTETETEFLNSYHFLNELPVSYFHVFTYSERSNTLAATLRPAVAQNERNRRSKMLRILSDKKKRFFYTQNIGKMQQVLWEAERQEGNFLHGFTQNYVKVKTPYDASLINTLQTITVDGVDAEGIAFISALQPTDVALL